MLTYRYNETEVGIYYTTVIELTIEVLLRIVGSVR